MANDTERQIEFRKIDEDATKQFIKAGWQPLASKVLVARGFTDPDSVFPQNPEMPTVNGGATSVAAQLLADAVRDKVMVCIVGDFDADGVCATALSVLALNSLGANCIWLLSNRQQQERSLDRQQVTKAKELGAQIIVTVDNGTSAHDGVDYAKSLGMTIIVTDHHIPDTSGVAKADVVVNPHLKDSGLPATHMCGAAVALMLFKEVFRRCGTKQRASKFLDLVAIATLVDQMPLNDEFNRWLVYKGIELIQKGRCRPAIKAMLRNKNEYCSCTTVNFQIGPMLNSPQRMTSPEISVETLLAEDIGLARKLVQELFAINRERKVASTKDIEKAKNSIIDGAQDAIVAYVEGMNIGIAGLVASNFSRKYKVPCVVFTKVNDKFAGSLRSPFGISLHQALSQIEKDNPELLNKWGGHDASAGISLNSAVKDLDLFTQKFKETCAALAKTKKTKTTLIDVSPTADELTDGSVDQLDDLPWGNSFSAPIFQSEFLIDSVRPANNGNGFNIGLSLEDTVFRSWTREFPNKVGTSIKLVYTLSKGHGNSVSPMINLV